MEITKKKEKYNKLLSRAEIVFEIKTDGPTPKKQDVIEKIANQEKKDKDAIVVVEIKQEFGKTICYVDTFIYDSAEKVLKRKKKKKPEEKKKK